MCGSIAPEQPAKQEKLKPHRTVRITRALLRKLEACSHGLVNVSRLLPATISTDPEDNLKLALRMMKARPWGDAGFDDPPANQLVWLLGKIGADASDGEPDYLTSDPSKPDQPQLDWTRSFFTPNEDAHLVAQQLAMIADHLLSARGR